MSIAIGRRTKIVLIALAAIVVAVLLVLAMLPVGWLKGTAENKLSERFGRQVTIASLEREDAFSFRPVIRVTGVRVPQPAWAGAGELATIRELRLRVPVLPLLIGQVRPEVLTASGVRLDLIRRADRVGNWEKPDAKKSRGGGGPGLDALGVADAEVRYRDAVQKREFTLQLRVDPAKGLTGNGTGAIDGAPVRLAVQGGAVKPGAWPFAAKIDGAAIAIGLRGTMAGPLNTGDMRFRMTARADDLKRIDRVIEAGLFGTQPVNVTADVRHAGRKWFVEGLSGTIGSSDIAGRVTVDKTGERVKLDGEVRSARLDFDDLASDSGLAKAGALKAAEGPKLVPNTRINLAKIDKTDGRIAVRIDRIVSRGGPSALRNAQGVLVLDRQRLVVEPLRIGLTRGAITGRAVVDQRGGGAEPIVMLALDLTGSSIGALGFAGSEDGVDARVDGRVRVAGRGSTIRAAVGRSNGTIGLVARDGAMPAKMASLLGFDVGRQIFGGDGDERAALRCAVVRLEMRGGRGTLSPLIIDTSRSQMRGTGTVSFPAEAIAATLTGAPKGDTVLRLPGAIAASGTIRDPKVVVPKEVKSVGNILKGIGRAITGKQGPEATDADCAGLTRRVIG